MCDQCCLAATRPASTQFKDNVTHLSYNNKISWKWQLIPWNRGLLDKITDSELVKKFPTFYGTQRFITAFTTARNLSISWARSIQYTPPHPASWISSLILSPIYAWVFQEVSLPKPFMHLSSPAYVLHAQFISFFSIWSPEYIWEEYRSLSSLLCSLFHSPVTSSLLGSNIFLSTLFSNTLSPPSSLNTRDQVSHSDKKQEKL